MYDMESCDLCSRLFIYLGAGAGEQLRWDIAGGAGLQLQVAGSCRWHDGVHLDGCKANTWTGRRNQHVRYVYR